MYLRSLHLPCSLPLPLLLLYICCRHVEELRERGLAIEKERS